MSLDKFAPEIVTLEVALDQISLERETLEVEALISGPAGFIGCGL